MKTDYLRELGALGKTKSEFMLKNNLYSQKRNDEVYPEERRRREFLKSLDGF